MSTITKESIADTIEGLEHLANSGIQSVYIDMAIAGMRSLLASLEAEPVAEVCEGFNLRYIGYGPAPKSGVHIGDKLYTAPPTPVVPEEMPKGLAGQIVSLLAHNIGDKFLAQKIWNACRAAMLQGAEPVTTAYKLPEGWVAVPIEPTEHMIVEGFESEPYEFFSKSEVWEAYQKMSGCEQAAHRAKLCWAAMIEAAPKLE